MRDASELRELRNRTARLVHQLEHDPLSLRSSYLEGGLDALDYCLAEAERVPAIFARAVDLFTAQERRRRLELEAARQYADADADHQEDPK